jgi:hypothetical protein
MAPIGFWQKNQPKKIVLTFKAQKWPKSSKIGQNGPIKMLMISKTSVFFHHTSPKLSLEYGPNWFLAKELAKNIVPTL